MGFAMVGNKSITALSDDSDAGRIANLMYNRYRDATLRSHFWNGAMKRDTLGSVVGSPEFGFTNRHALPTDFIRLKAIEGDPEFRLETTKYVMSNESAIKILYVYRVEDPGQLTDLYADALATRLASAFAARFRNPKLAVELWLMYEKKLSYARFVDSTENTQDHLLAQTFTVTGRTAMPFEYGRTDI